MDPTAGNPNEKQGAAGETTGASLTDIMGTMAGDKPEVKPAADVADGKKAEGNTNEPETKLPAWTSQLPEDMRSNADVMKQLGKFNKIGDLAKSYSELEGKLGNSLTKPGENASAEEVDAFYQKLGKPATAEEYTINDKDAADFKTIAYKNNLSNAQAMAIYEELKTAAAGAMQAQQQAVYQKAKDTEDALKAEYGNHYSEKLTMLQRGVNTYGGKELGEKLKATGLLFDKDIAKMFILLGEQAAEAGSITKGAGHSNYTSIADGGHLSFGEDFK